MKFHQRAFDPAELKKVDASGCVVLNSGGPLMQLECIEGDNAVCSWVPPDPKSGASASSATPANRGVARWRRW